MISQDTKDAHPVGVHADRLIVRCEGCGWVAAISSTDNAKHLARLHWSLMEGRDGR